MSLDAENRAEDPGVRLALRAAKIGIWSWDIASGEVRWYPEVFEIFGQDPETFAPSYEGFLSLIDEGDRERVRAVVEDHVARGDPDAEYFVGFPVRTPAGEPRWIEARGQLLVDDQGAPAGLIGVVQDLSGRRQQEEERRDLERRVLHAQKLESLGVLAGGIAHDFNNLLLAVQGNADLARMDLPGNSSTRTYLDEICAASHRAAELCQQMLAYSGRGKFSVEVLDLNGIVEEMVRILTVSISKKAELELKLQDGLPAIRADGTQIRQVLMNLITNASEALGDGSGRITVRTTVRDVDPDTSGIHPSGDLPDGKYVMLEVVDDGCGMDEVTREKMFDPFYTTKFAGRGLGMAAVLGIVSGHRGTLGVKSSPGNGTSVQVLLPATTEISKPPRRPDTDLDWRASGTVLVVDDEEVARMVARRMLEKLGLRVVLAGDGREALELFQRTGSRLDFVLLDLTMPEMDGVETLVELRKLKGGDLPVLVTSGYSADEVRARFADEDLAGFVLKPYELSTLREFVRSALGG